MPPTQYIPRPGTDSSAFDFSQLSSLKREVQNGSSAAANKKVAQQFEAVFIQMLLKQARQGSILSGPFDSEQTRMAQSMSDEQMGVQLANPGIGLAQALLNQMKVQHPGGDAASQASSMPTSATPPELSTSRLPGLRSRIGPDSAPVVSSISALIDLLSKQPVAGAVASAISGAPEHIRSFVSAMSAAAKAAADRSGVPVKLMLSQAALESGWGQRPILGADGSPSYNLFGIKAGSSWKGKVVNVLTTEYQDGVPQKVMQPFRAYGSYAESFADYASLIGNSPRYQAVVQAPSAEVAAQKIQDAGYATDPAYAQKLISIMGYFNASPA
ncbi:MAG: flagellar assembly peptidoglycan hydrolase FlgJ [Candidimonas sp.]|nr:MAG: flagellar assembly peptidoglycan hydrolase FlgJ [Candidimonas sp.]